MFVFQSLQFIVIHSCHVKRVFDWLSVDNIEELTILRNLQVRLKGGKVLGLLIKGIVVFKALDFLRMKFPFKHCEFVYFFYICYLPLLILRIVIGLPLII